MTPSPDRDDRTPRWKRERNRPIRRLTDGGRTPPTNEDRTPPADDVRLGGTGATTIDGVRLRYRRAGTSGPPVVLLHGGGVDDATLSWKYTIGALADSYRVYALDWPGYGDSENGISHSTANYVDLLDGFLAAVNLDRPSIAGISMGGAAALGYTLENPNSVERLVLVDSYGLGERIPVGPLWKTFAHLPGSNAMGWATLGFSSETARMGLEAVVYDAGELPADFVTDVRERASRPGAGLAFEAFQRNEIRSDGTARTNYAGELESLSTPTLFVHGAADPLFPATWSKRAADSCPNATLAIIEECGHWVPRERPVLFNERLRAFLSRTNSPS